MKIRDIKAREILDSRGNPTVEADVFLVGGEWGRASVPSGASTGSNEAVELRDGDKKRFLGKGVLRAVENINTEIKKVLIGVNPENQRDIDKKMIELDGTPNKGRLGANAILAVSLAIAKAVANAKEIPLYQYVRELSEIKKKYLLPLPMCNVINGGKHADNSTDIQEFMIVPSGARTFKDAVRMTTEVFHNLKRALIFRKYGTNVGDEGGYAPSLRSGNKEALSIIQDAVKMSGYVFGTDIVIALDVASSGLLDREKYSLKTESRFLDVKQMIEYYADLLKEFPIVSIEDGLAEGDWNGWKQLTLKLGDQIQLVGDDLLVTNTKFLDRAIREKVGNAILVKVNQVGTLSETIQAVDMAHKANWNAIISHRSGETEDTTISHIAVGLGTGQIKTGSMSRTDRVAKYNELLRIEEAMGNKAIFQGDIIFRK